MGWDTWVRDTWVRERKSKVAHDVMGFPFSVLLFRDMSDLRDS